MRNRNVARNKVSRAAGNQTKTKPTPIARAELERVIAETVKASSPECQDFVAVILERTASAAPGGANWAVKGVKYGKANRELCNAALSNCLLEKQLKFELLD